MKRHIATIIVVIVIAALAIPALANDTQELRFLCYQDGNECEVYADMLARFTAESGIAVAVEIAPESEIVAALADGLPADIVRLSDPSSIPDDTFGTPDSLAVIAPFVNLSLFAEAGVSVPDDGETAASWDEWLEALELVVERTDAQYALAVDNKGHRLVGPAMSLGAQYFDAESNLTLPDDSGLRAFLSILSELLDAGMTPQDTLLGTGKSQDYFTRGETVMYICGSWKVEEVAQQVGADFDWAVLPNPSGAGGSTAVAQATSLVAQAGAPNSQAVKEVMEWLARSGHMREFARRTLLVPAMEYAADDTLAYDTDDPVVAAALNAFAREALNLQDQAGLLHIHPWAGVYYAASDEYLRAYFAGDVDMDEALAGIKAALADAQSASLRPDEETEGK